MPAFCETYFIDAAYRDKDANSEFSVTPTQTMRRIGGIDIRVTLRAG
jgi:hypothetical protein